MISQLYTRIFKSHWTILLLLIFWAIFYNKILFLHYLFYIGDNHAFDIPHRVFFIQEILERRIPLWNPYIMSGTPFLLVASQGILSLSTFLFFLFPPATAMSLGLILNNLLAGVLMYFFTFLLTKKHLTAFYSSLVYMLAGFTTSATNAIIIMAELPLIPLAFLFTQLAITRNSRYLYLLPIVFFLQFTSGFPLLLYITILSISIHYLLSSPRALIKKVLDLALVGLISICLASILLLPQWEFTQLSTRPQSDFNYATSSSFHPRDIITFFLPHAFGIPEIQFGQNVLNKNYLGILPLVFLITTLIYKRKIIPFSLIVLTLGGAFLSFGKYFPLYRLFLLLPGLASFREPETFIIMFVFGGSVTSALGLHSFTSSPKSLSLIKKIYPKKLSTFLTVLTLFCSLALLWLYLSPLSYWQDLIKVVQPLLFPQKNLLQLLAKQEKVKLLATISFENITIAILLIFTFLECLKRIRKPGALIYFVIIATFLDLFFLNHSNLFLIKERDYQTIYAPFKIPQIIKENSQIYRIHSLQHYQPPLWQNYSKDEYLAGRVKNASDVLYPNRHMLYGISQAIGFSPLVYAPYAQYLTQNSTSSNTNLVTVEIDIESSQLAKVGARYILSDRLIDKLSPPRYALLDNNLPHYALYEDTTARKRTFLLNSQNQETDSARIISSLPNKVVIETKSSDSTQLILLDTMYPGWQATVDSTPAPIKTFEQVFRQVDLTSGTHTVVFDFKPQSLRLGALISSITLLFYLTSLVLIFNNGKLKL